MTSETFAVKQTAFEGPFSVLLDAIKDEKVNVFEVSLSEVTSAYFEHLKKIEKIDLENSSEFLVMAAYLLELKSKRLLPQPEEIALLQEEQEIEEDLAKHLEEYKIFKLAAQTLQERKDSFARVYSRYHRELLRPEKKDFFLTEVSLEDLVKAFQNVYVKVSERPHVVGIKDEEITLPQRIGEVIDILKSNPDGIDFEKLFIRWTRLEVVVTFLAILELAKNQYIDIYQGEEFGKINVRLSKA